MHTDVRGWVRELRSGIQRDGLSAKPLLKSARGAFNGPYFTLTTRYPMGTNVYDRDWDLLIVLDACRVDALEAVAPEYDFIQSVDSIWSVGTASHEWLCKTFTREHLDEIRETVHITTNPFVPKVFDDHTYPPETYSVPLMWPKWDVVDRDDFKEVINIHRHDYEDISSSPPPQSVTDYAIDAGRRTSFDRMILHYFQPHTPYIAEAYEERRSLTDVERDPWQAVWDGIATKEEIEDLYMENLRYALDSIEVLLRNIDAEKVVITADHGDLFGEWGAWGHPEGFPHPDLKRVPWATATATDTGEYVPEVDVEKQMGAKDDVERRLAELGYL